MINFLRWIFGYVKFEFSNGFTEGFINTCYEYGIGIFNIIRLEDKVTACCPLKRYKDLHLAAKINGGKIKPLKKRGVIIPFLKLKNRWGLFIGGLLFIIIINFLSGFIWNIDIKGNNEISDNEILLVLNKNNFSIGSRWNDIDKGSIESMLMASIEKCSWVSINKKGCTADVEINESIAKPKIKKTGYANVKATKDGIIVDAIVYNGWKVAEKGDGVTKGDLLISGIYEGESTKTTLFAHAQGKYMAQVKENINLTINRHQKEKVYNKNKKYKSICFFGITIPLYIGSFQKNNADITEEYRYLNLNGKTLPIGILTTNVKEYAVIERTLNDKELTKLAQIDKEKYIESIFKNCEVLKDDTQITLNEGCATINGSLLCIENIGQEVAFSVNEKQNE